MVFKKGNQWGKLNKGKENLVVSLRMKETNPMKNIEAREKVRVAMLGTKHHTTKHTEESKRLMALRNRGKHLSIRTEFKKGSSGFNRRHTEESKRLMSESLKIALNNPITREKMREARARQVIPMRDTSIELKIRNYLTELHLEYYMHKYLSDINHKYQCDFYIPTQLGIKKKLIIECDGCYWHGCRICNPSLKEFQIAQIEEDNTRTQELKATNYNVLRLWEHQINELNSDEFRRIICEI